MTTEQKARAYDEALKKVNSKWHYKNQPCFVDIAEIFPQLKESEDERIQKEILELVSISGNGNQFEEIKDWLEEQREKDKLIKELGVYKVKYMQEVINQQLEKQEHVNSPRFKVGDWITNGNAVNHISNIRDDGFYCFDYGPSSDMIQYIDNTYHLWTIADAEDGDILAFKDSTSGVLIYKDYINTVSGVLSYCRTVRDRFISKEESGWGPTLLFPATKEQRNYLFEKMHEAGYEWNKEKKELRKIEKQDEKPADTKIMWHDVSEEPEEMKELLVEWDSEDATWHEVAFYHADTKTFWDGERQVENVTRWCYIDDILEKQGEQKPQRMVSAEAKEALYDKPKWGEEDESKVGDIMYFFNTAKTHYASTKAIDDCVTWLKSLKERMEGK